MTTTYLGVIDGIRTWEVRDEAGNVVGMNQQAVDDSVPEIGRAHV